MESDYHATEKRCSVETRVHLEKSVIKARHGPFSRHGQCNDLNALRWKNESSAMTLGRAACENEWKGTLENKSRKKRN